MSILKCYCIVIMTLILQVQLVHCGVGKTCTVPLDNLQDYAPLMLDTENNLQKPTTQDGFIVIQGGHYLNFACTGLNNALNQPEGVKTKTFISCVCNSQTGAFNYNNRVMDLTQLKCKKVDLCGFHNIEPEYSVQRNTDKTCLTTKTLYNIGFTIPTIPNVFTKLFEVCYDTENKIAQYAKYLISSHAQMRRCPGRCRVFKDSTPMLPLQNEFFSYSWQKNYFRSIFSINSPMEMLQSGHLAPACAFFTKSVRCATFDILNVAPQFGLFNNNNWNYIENYLLDFAAREQKDMIAYTGTAGVGTYGLNELHLMSNKRLRAPRYYWTIQMTPDRKKAVAFIGANTSPNESDINSPAFKTVDNLQGLKNEKAFVRFNKPQRIGDGVVKCITVNALKDLIGSEFPDDIGSPKLLDTDIIN